MRFWRMAAGSGGRLARGESARRRWSSCHIAGGRVSWQASVSAAPRRQRGLTMERSSVNRASGTFRGASHRGGLIDQRGTRPATVHGGASCADPNWHVYPKGARRAARWIFAGCGAAGRGILKGQAK